MEITSVQFLPFIVINDANIIYDMVNANDCNQ